VSDWEQLAASRLGLRVAVDGGVTTLALRGELDVSAGGGLLDRLEVELTREPDEIVFDLAELDFIDSTGLRTLLQARDICDRCAARLSIVEGRGHVARVFDLTGLDEVLPVVSRAREVAEASE
jgi:anti-anti-sigma factor